MRAERSWSPATLDRLQMIASAFAAMLARRKSDESLRLALAQVSHLKEELQADQAVVRKDAPERISNGPVIGESPALRLVQDQVQQVAATDSTVLLLGETGSGKEMFATQVHELSGRRNRAMIRVNCAAIPSTLIESELFGREKGAYTGALARQIGRFEMADRSTIFLDEIGDLPLEVQVKLLRVLEERQIERLGSPKPIRVDTRIIAATHRDLEQLIAAGTFREDLYYRLCVFPIRVPPLRERAGDIPLLVWRFVEEFSAAFGKQDRVDRQGRHVGVAAVSVAGEHPRAPQRGRARDDHGHGPPPDVPPPRVVVERRGQAQSEAGGRRAGAHPHGTREHGLACSRRGRRGRPAWSSSHHARKPAGQARAQAPVSSVSRCLLGLGPLSAVRPRGFERRADGIRVDQR